MDDHEVSLCIECGTNMDNLTPTSILGLYCRGSPHPLTLLRYGTFLLTLSWSYNILAEIMQEGDDGNVIHRA